MNIFTSFNQCTLKQFNHISIRKVSQSNPWKAARNSSVANSQLVLIRNENSFSTEQKEQNGSSAPQQRQTLVRLSKRMSELNLCSRREADQLISQCRVLVNGKPVHTLGSKVSSVERNIRILHDDNPNYKNNHFDDAESKDEDFYGDSISDKDSDCITVDNIFDWDKIRGDTVVLHKPKNYVSGQPDPKHGHIPAVRLLTRNNIYFPPGKEYDELKYTLSCGKYLHFARRKKIQRRIRNENGIFDDEESPSSSISATPSTLMNYAPAGRLDLDSSGVLIFTKNGVIAKRILSQSIQKEYIVEVEPVVNITRQERNMGLKFLPYPPKWDLGELIKGGKRLWNDRTPLKPVIDAKWIEEGKNANGEWNGRGKIKFVLQEGKKRQIRRMCRELLGLNVIELQRVRVGSVAIGTLPEGHWRTLTELEVKELLA